MQIDKIKFKGLDSPVIIHYRQRNEAGEYDKLTLECHDMPAPDFVAALTALAPHVADICELPGEPAAENMRVIGVSFSRPDGAAWGATITALIKLANSNGPLVLNTPHKPSEACYDGDRNALPDACVMDLERLERAAEKYVNGFRAQTALPLEGSK